MLGIVGILFHTLDDAVHDVGVTQARMIPFQLQATLVQGFARQVANRVIFMDTGQIIEANTPEEFFNHPQHERTKLFLSQILH